MLEFSHTVFLGIYMVICVCILNLALFFCYVYYYYSIGINWFKPSPIFILFLIYIGVMRYNAGDIECFLGPFFSSATTQPT